MLERLSESFGFSHELLAIADAHGWSPILTRAFAGGMVAVDEEADPEQAPVGWLAIARKNGLEARSVGETPSKAALALLREISFFEQLTA